MVRCYVGGKEEVTPSSKTLLRLKFNPGVAVLWGKTGPFTTSSTAIRSQTGDLCGWESWISTYKYQPVLLVPVPAGSLLVPSLNERLRRDLDA